MKLENNLGTDPIRPLVLRIAIPSMLAQFVSVLYSIVDRIYISNIPVIGETALAGVGVCGPVVTLIGAFASLIGVGGAPLMSIRMGAGKTEEARKILSNSFLMLCVCSVALMAAVFPLRQPMLMAFGASGATYGYANTYFIQPAGPGAEPVHHLPGLRPEGHDLRHAGGGAEHHSGPGVHLRLRYGGGRGRRGHGALPAGQLPLCAAVPLQQVRARRRHLRRV